MVKSPTSRIETILKHINLIQEDINNMSFEEFKESDLLVRATCFSLCQIGEHMNRLEKDFSEKYPNIPWRNAIDMRNLIIHVYSKVKAEVVYLTAKNNLDDLKQALLEMKSDLEKKEA